MHGASHGSVSQLAEANLWPKTRPVWISTAPKGGTRRRPSCRGLHSGGPNTITARAGHRAHLSRVAGSSSKLGVLGRELRVWVHGPDCAGEGGGSETLGGRGPG